MRRALRVASAAATALSWLAVASAAASAAPLPPSELRVEGGEETWHPQSTFRLEWQNPEPTGGSPIAAVHYRVRDSLGAVVIPERRIDWPAEVIGSLQVPSLPDAYLAEVWLEDSTGAQGPAATARLRFDDVRPGRSEPLPEPSWIGRTAFPYTVRLGHPAGPHPISGIRGYAVSIDGMAQGDPCQAADRCADTEVDLRGGLFDDSLPVLELPEGTSYVHLVAVSGSLMKSASPGQTPLRVDKTDPVTRLTGAPGGWASQAVALRATATDALSGMSPVGEGGAPFTAIRIDGGTPVAAPGGSVAASVIAEGIHTVAFYARDAAGNVDDGGTTNGKPDSPPQTALVRIDRTPPDAAFSNSQDWREPETIRIKVADPLSGPSRSRGWIGVRREGSGDRFEELPSRAEGDRLSAHWESDDYPPGEYEFRAIGYDAAGNGAATMRRANGTRMVLPNPLKGSTALSGHLRGAAGRGTIAYGSTALFAGRLTTARGRPLGSMPVRVVERFAPDAAIPSRVSTVPTGWDGSFAVRLSPGPNREVTAVFDGTRGFTRFASEPRPLRVRTAIRMTASASSARVGGRPIVFRGAVLAEPRALPPGGKSVQLQFRAPGVPWTEFRTIQTGARGRFRYAYRFSDDDSRGVRFEFRAYAPAQDGWPYEPWGSRPVAVRGR